MAATLSECLDGNDVLIILFLLTVHVPNDDGQYATIARDRLTVLRLVSSRYAVFL